MRSTENLRSKNLMVSSAVGVDAVDLDRDLELWSESVGIVGLLVTISDRARRRLLLLFVVDVDVDVFRDADVDDDGDDETTFLMPHVTNVLSSDNFWWIPLSV